MLKAFCSSFVESEDDHNDKGSGDQEEKGAYEKKKGDTEEDKDVEESADRTGDICRSGGGG